MNASRRFPAVDTVWTDDTLSQKLKSWIVQRKAEANRDKTVAGAKYPHLCRFAEHLHTALGDSNGCPVLDPSESDSKSPPVLSDYLHSRVAEFDQISDSRQTELANAADLIHKKLSANETVQLNFICTHNSRRSHLAQIWTTVAAHHFGIANVVTFSGGTEATAMNPRIVATLRRAGLSVSRTDDSEGAPNPHYLVRYATSEEALECFSKIYNEPPNPEDAFVAVLVCGNADRACPIVTGATDRLVIRYEDPKVSDDTPEESSIYDERCAQISREMLFMISQIK